VTPGQLQLPISISADDFQLFDLPKQFALNRDELDQRWKALQKQVHPDRFSTQGAADKRLAMQWSVRINEAYQRLKNPLKRAAYLCELNGAVIHAENNTSMTSDFLMQQMQWREILDEAEDLSSVETLLAEITAAKEHAYERFIDLIDDQMNWELAVQEVRSLMFLERFESDIHARIERLEDA